MLRDAGAIEMTDAAVKLAASAETIRKDLISLEERGHLQRVRGGAIPLQGTTFEPEVESRDENLEAKRRIAQKALERLPEGGAILLDAGSTTQMLADLIPQDFPLKVFTNSLPVAQTLLSKPSVECFTTGGRVRANTSAEVGSMTLGSLGPLHVDVAFVGTNALSLKRGLSTPDPEEAAVKAAMIQCAASAVLLTDHTKFGRDALCSYAALEDIDVLITDEGLTEENRADLHDQPFEVEIV